MLRVAIDANVWIDFLEKRYPYYPDAANCITRAKRGQFHAVVPAHLVTTLFYGLRKSSGKERAVEIVNWIIDLFEIAECNHDTLRQAAGLTFSDFEDAVVAACAKQSGCDMIVTRNLKDFSKSPVPVISPDALLQELREKQR
jgi:predicted nucleic acid-binding protein